MEILGRLRDFLDKNNVQYQHTSHGRVYTAREAAFAEHLPPHNFAKTVVFFSENGYGMAVLPADTLVDLNQLRQDLGLARLRLATESELDELFSDCEVGAMPPFGNLYGIPVYMDSIMTGQQAITFNAGTHQDVVHMRLRDYERLVKPAVVPFIRVAAV
jgi:Ala-tRNA(Pro) deacylase